MSADDDLKKAVADLGVASNDAAAAIQAELAKIAASSNDPVVADAVTAIRGITANLAAAAQSVTNPAPASEPVPQPDPAPVDGQ